MGDGADEVQRGHVAGEDPLQRAVDGTVSACSSDAGAAEGGGGGGSK